MTDTEIPTKASFSLQGHNPDVLTCIANLSNDEVFTPPELASQMLDTLADAWAEANHGANIWADPRVTFLDPFTKSGVFLREIVSRLTAGLQSWMPNLEDRVDHILTKQVFGIGITQLTALLARRSVYCSKDATGAHSIASSFDRDWGNIWFERTEHTWVGRERVLRVHPETGRKVWVDLKRSGKCKYCGAAGAEYARDDLLETHAYAFIHTDDIKARIGELFGADMQFDVIIGNPPYQLSDESSDTSTGRIASATPIYQDFVEQAKNLGPRYVTMVIPSRWMAGGRGLEKFRQVMLSDQSLRDLVDYPSATDVFGQGVRVSGGICYFLREKGRRDTTRVTTVRGAVASGPIERRLDEYDVFIRDTEAIEIVHAVLKAKCPAIEELFNPGFGLDTNFSDFTDEPLPNSLTLHLNVGGMGHQRATKYVDGSLITRCTELIDKWKVLVPSAAGYGAEQLFDRVLGKPIIAAPGEVGTQTYRVVGPFNSESEAQSFVSYYSTRFFRFLVSLRKVTQHASPSVYRWVPVQTWDRMWDDKELFEKYSIGADDQAYMATRIRDVDWAIGLGDAKTH